METDCPSLLFISSFNDGMNVRALPITGSNMVLKKPVSESILSINATLPMGKVTFSGIIPFWGRNLLQSIVAKSGYQFHAVQSNLSNIF
jgi:hypothetical protein